MSDSHGLQNSGGIRATSRGMFAALVIALLSLTAVRPAFAQVLFGSIVGSVSDASGAAVPGATVRVTQTETNETRETKTNDSCGFTLSTVHTGPYKVAVAKEGFKSYTADNIQVSVNTVVRVDPTLEIGSQAQSVDVSAQAVTLQTDKMDVHNSEQIVPDQR
jgi:hypothetical protein